MTGKWKTSDGRYINIAEMTSDHLRFSMMYMYRKMQPNPVPTTTPAPTVNTTWQSKTSTKYYEDKLVELGEEAQKRNWVPQEITFEGLLQVVGQWENEWQARKSARVASQYNAPNMQNAADYNRQLDARAAAPPSRLSMFVDVESHAVAVIRVGLPKPKKIKLERNISFDL